MASKRGRGRPSGSVDKSRDYGAALAEMRAMVAKGASHREAAAVVGKERGIPPSTLRKHLAKKSPIAGPRFSIFKQIATEVVTPEQAEEAARRYQEKRLLRRKEEEDEELRRSHARRHQMLFELGLPSSPPPAKKKPTK